MYKTVNNSRVLQQYNQDSCIPLKEACRLGEIEFEALKRFSYPGYPMPNQMLPGVNSIGYWDALTEQKWGLDWHRNEGLELTFLETGSLFFSIGGQRSAVLRANDLTITRPWQLHKVGNPNVGIGRLYWLILDVNVRNSHQLWKWPDWIILSKKDVEDLTTVLRQNEQLVWHTNKKIQSCFREIGLIVKDSENEAKIYESQLIILINELLLNLLYAFRKEDALLDRKLTEGMRSAELFLSKLPSLLDRNWTLQSMAEQCSLGTTYFVHCCKKITNMTPMQYLNYHRLELAAEILTRHPEMSIADIAYDSGFTSSQYFATVFKKRYRTSPKSFRDTLF